MTLRWQLTKKANIVRCMEVAHPLGFELRVSISARGSGAGRGGPASDRAGVRGGAPREDDLRRSEVFRDRGAADAAASEWRAAFEARGWQQPPSRFARAALDRALALTRHAQMRVPGDNAMGHVLSYRLKVMREALEVAIADDVSLDQPLRDKRLVDAMTELARAERGPEGQAFVKPILDALRDVSAGKRR